MVAGIGGGVFDTNSLAAGWVLVRVLAGVVDGGMFGAGVLQLALLLLGDAVAGLEATTNEDIICVGLSF